MTAIHFSAGAASATIAANSGWVIAATHCALLAKNVISLVTDLVFVVTADRADGRAREQGEHHLGAVLRVDEHLVADRDAAIGQARREPVHVGQQLARRSRCGLRRRPGPRRAPGGRAAGRPSGRAGPGCPGRASGSRGAAPADASMSQVPFDLRAGASAPARPSCRNRAAPRPSRDPAALLLRGQLAEEPDDPDQLAVVGQLGDVDAGDRDRAVRGHQLPPVAGERRGGRRRRSYRRKW